MRRISLCFLVAAIIVPPSVVEAQAITGFASVPWGASRDEVEAEWGRPTRVDEEGSLVTLRYAAQDFAGPKPIRGWSMMFGLRDDQLLSGRYVGLFTREPIAEEARRRMVEEVHSQYSFFSPRDCTEPEDEARFCRVYVNSAHGDPVMEQMTGSWRSVKMIVTQEFGEWALITEYMTAAEWAADNREEAKRY
jgi:hypothetical protein